jgi:hypothetical protein
VLVGVPVGVGVPVAVAVAGAVVGVDVPVTVGGIGVYVAPGTTILTLNAVPNNSPESEAMRQYPAYVPGEFGATKSREKSVVAFTPTVRRILAVSLPIKSPPMNVNL